MHELGITQQIIDLVMERAQGRKVRRVTLEIGRLAAISTEAIRFCFEVCTEGTEVERAELEIPEVPGRARCRICGTEISLEVPYGRCQCGSSDLDWISWDELSVKSMELN